MNDQKIIFSGIQPSGNLHLGNYLGAIKQWVEMQTDHNCVFCIVDYHAITVPQDPAILREKIIDIAKIYIAAGIDPKRAAIFKQSDIKEHTELAWILNCTTARMSDLENMTQYKDKAEKYSYNEYDLKHQKDQEKIFFELMDKLSNEETRGKRLEFIDDLKIFYNKEMLHPDKVVNYIEGREPFIKKNVGVGLFDYPVLMAADILLYNTDIVPVGDDQVQHVELCRDLAKRFNHQFGETFKIPSYKIQKHGARIMGLDDPTKKMSKSAKSEFNYIALTDDIEKAKKKIMRATTDSESLIKYDPDKKPGISNLLTIYALLENSGGETMDGIRALEKRYIGKNYGDLKKDLAEIVASFLTKFQKSYYNISTSEIEKILKAGARKLQPTATEMINKVKNKIGSI